MSLATIVWFWFTLLEPKTENDELAIAIATVVSEMPPLYANDPFRYREAATLTSIAWYESNFRHGVTGDHGNAHCEFQLWNAPKDVDDDRTLCVGLALERVRESMRLCPKDRPLCMYVSGPKGLHSDRAKVVSDSRMATAKYLVSKFPK